jgi:ABC-type lipoprotein export system ATPase subunit
VSGAPEVLVRCAGVSRTFRRGDVEVCAVRAVSCEVTAGMRVALTGPSGSGKSTLLHLLAGLDRPTAGTVTRRPGLDDAQVGVAFQGPSLIPALDVTENVALPLLLVAVPPAQAVDRAHAALERLGLARLRGSLPEALSGGQVQRVAIARALVGRPRLLLADEPTGQLDRETAEHVTTVLLEAADELGAALVVSTHDPAVASRLPTTWPMHDGALRPAGTP